MNPGSHAKYQVPQAAQAWNVLDFFIKPVFRGGIRQNVIQDQGDETDLVGGLEHDFYFSIYWE